MNITTKKEHSLKHPMSFDKNLVRPTEVRSDLNPTNMAHLHQKMIRSACVFIKELIRLSHANKSLDMAKEQLACIYL